MISIIWMGLKHLEKEKPLPLLSSFGTLSIYRVLAILRGRRTNSSLIIVVLCPSLKICFLNSVKIIMIFY